MSTRPPSRVVFVGNIPYGLSEEQICDIFSQAGKVLNFRLVYDRETGRPKGFGFAEYPDADSAASAVRNLNDHDIMGRKLRVDFSNEGVSEDDGGGRDRDGGNNSSYTNGNNHGNKPSQSTSLPALPPGTELPPGITCTDQISRTLNTLQPNQLLDVLAQMKSLATSDPARATELLNQAPQLSYAVFQALLLMGLVSPESINSVMENPSGPVAPPPAAVPPPQAAAMQGGFAGFPAPYAQTPPVGAGGYAPPPPPQVQTQQPAPAPAAPAGQDPAAVLQQVLALPQEVVDQLPELERSQIMAIRAQYGAR